MILCKRIYINITVFIKNKFDSTFRSENIISSGQNDIFGDHHSIVTNVNIEDNNDIWDYLLKTSLFKISSLDVLIKQFNKFLVFIQRFKNQKSYFSLLYKHKNYFSLIFIWSLLYLNVSMNLSKFLGDKKQSDDRKMTVLIVTLGVIK